MKRLLYRALVCTLLAALVEAATARLLAGTDPVGALISGGTVALAFVPLYLTRLFLYFVAPPWLVVRVVRAIQK